MDLLDYAVKLGLAAQQKYVCTKCGHETMAMSTSSGGFHMIARTERFEVKGRVYEDDVLVHCGLYRPFTRKVEV